MLMRSKLYFVYFLLLISYRGISQNIGIGTTRPDSSAAVDITATDKGVLVPRMSLVSINAILRAAKGLLAYDSVANQLMVNVGTPAAPDWQPVAGSTDSVWNLAGNRGTDPGTQFLGTTDNQPLRFRVNNIPAGELNPVTGNIYWGLQAGRFGTTGFSNIGIGAGALQSDSTNSNQVAVGDSALQNNTGGANNTAVGSKTLLANTTGSFNTAIGANSLAANNTGSSNTATGFGSLAANTNGQENVANGQEALASNISGSFNVAFGFQSLFNNTTATSNTAIGVESLFSNTTGASNTATGSTALFSNTTGNSNVANGISSLFANTTGSDNTAVGFEALLFNSTGIGNTAVGSRALFSNDAGGGNVAIGQNAMQGNTNGSSNVAVGNGALGSNTNGADNVAIGFDALSTANIDVFTAPNTAVGTGAGNRFALGGSNTLIGSNAQAWGDGATNCVALGANSQCTKDNQVMLGNSTTFSISGFADFSKLSDGRFKKNIQENVRGLAFIMKLRPVTYQVDITALNRNLGLSSAKHAPTAKSISEGEAIVHTGFVAQEVEQAAKDLGFDFSGVDKPQREGGLYALRYAEFVVPLVKAVQEQQPLIEELGKRHNSLANEMEAVQKSNADQQSRYDDLEKRIERLEETLNKRK